MDNNNNKGRLRGGSSLYLFVMSVVIQITIFASVLIEIRQYNKDLLKGNITTREVPVVILVVDMGEEVSCSTRGTMGSKILQLYTAARSYFRDTLRFLACVI